MSKNRCQECGSNDIYIEELCPNHIVNFVCRACGHSGEESEFTDATLFDHITESPEAMAAKLVYRDGEHKLTFSVVVRGKEQKMGHECWRSTIIPGDCWAEYDRAYAATVEKLKEVYNE